MMHVIEVDISTIDMNLTWYWYPWWIVDTLSFTETDETGRGNVFK